MNHLKQQFEWGDGTEDDIGQGLVEPDPQPTDALLAEIPGVSLEEDIENYALEMEHRVIQ